MRRFPFFLILLLVFSTPLSAATDITSSDNLKQKSSVSPSTPPRPASKPTGPPRVSQPAPVRQIKVNGVFNHQGTKLLLLINRPVKKVELYEGTRKITELRGGLKFEVTNPITTVKGKIVKVVYHDLHGNITSQQLTIPKSFVKKHQAGRMIQKLPVPRPPTPVPGNMQRQGDQLTLQPNLGVAQESLNPTGPMAPLPNYPPHHGHIEVIMPALNDFVSAGQQHDIVWNVHGYLTIDCSQVFLYQDGNQVQVINNQVNSRVIPGQEGIHWNVAPNLAGLYTVEVKTCDNEASDMSDSFLIISPEPDLSVQNVSITPANPTSNDTIRVRATVTNMGNTVADSSRVVLTVRDPDGIDHTFNILVSTLAFGAHTYIEKEYKVNRGGTYEHTLTAEVILSTALETHLDNNEVSENVTIKGLPDLVACFDAIMTGDVWHYKDIYGYVKNIGDGQAGPTTVNVWAEGKGTASYNLPIMVSTQSETVIRSNLLWALDGNKEFYFNVDPGDAITERKEDNNRRDGIIKIHGCTLAEMAVGACSPPSDPDWSGCSGGIPVYQQPYTVTEVN